MNTTSMIDIRLVVFYEAPDAFDICEADLDQEIDEQLEEYVVANVHNIDSPGFVVQDFEVPDTLDRQLILDICNGKSMGIWTQKSVDFDSELYLSWIFAKNNENKWEQF